MRHVTARRCIFGVAASASILASCGRLPLSSAPSLISATAKNRWSSPRLRSLESATGIYVTEYRNGSNGVVLGYRSRNRDSDKPICSKASPYAHDIAVDIKGNLIVAGGFGQATVYGGRSACRKKLGALQVGWSGLAVDAASINAVNGTVAVAALQDGSGPGSIEICTLSDGCTANLKNDQMNFVIGVALAKDGTCWASSQEGPGTGYAVVLTYFKGCTGSGETARDFQNLAPGGLDIDNYGDLVSVSSSPSSAVYVYSGCRPRCKLIGGPFPLRGTTTYGHLNMMSTRFVAADSQFSEVDVYKYSPAAMTYLYSFNNGIAPSSGIMGAAFDPRSKE
jgi:hypothetical protein